MIYNIQPIKIENHKLYVENSGQYTELVMYHHGITDDAVGFMFIFDNEYYCYVNDCVHLLVLITTLLKIDHMVIERCDKVIESKIIEELNKIVDLV